MSLPAPGPRTAMVLAAGLGTRMRPLTDDRPKALVELAGRPLIDHMLDRLVEAGVERAVVNVHAFADQLEAHLKTRASPHIVISDERAGALETGGGLKRAMPLLGEGPVWVANIDSVWIPAGPAALAAVAEAYAAGQGDVCLMLAPTATSLGFHASGDVFLGSEGIVRFKDPGEIGPFVYVGVHICDPRVVADGPEGAFSLLPVWKGLALKARVRGVSPSGLWMHVGDPAARDLAQARLKGID